MWECLYLDLLLTNLNLKFLLKFLPYLHAKRKKENTVSCCILLLFEYAWVITIFYRSFNNWIIDVIWDRVAVNIFCNFEVAYNIGKEGIQNFTCITSLLTISSSSVKVTFFLDTILSDKNSLIVFQNVLLSVTFFRQDCYNIAFWIF